MRSLSSPGVLVGGVSPRRPEDGFGEANTATADRQEDLKPCGSESKAGGEPGGKLISPIMGGSTNSRSIDDLLGACTLALNGVNLQRAEVAFTSVSRCSASLQRKYAYTKKKVKEERRVVICRKRLVLRLLYHNYAIMPDGMISLNNVFLGVST